MASGLAAPAENGRIETALPAAIRPRKRRRFNATLMVLSSLVHSYYPGLSKSAHSPQFLNRGCQRDLLGIEQLPFHPTGALRVTAHLDHAGGGRDIIDEYIGFARVKL